MKKLEVIIIIKTKETRKGNTQKAAEVYYKYTDDVHFYSCNAVSEWIGYRPDCGDLEQYAAITAVKKTINQLHNADNCLSTATKIELIEELKQVLLELEAGNYHQTNNLIYFI